MKIFANHYAKRGDDRGKSKSSHEAVAHMPKIKTGDKTCLQETSALDLLTKSSLSLQADRAVHSAPALQQSLQHHQGPILGQASEAHPV